MWWLTTIFLLTIIDHHYEPSLTTIITINHYKVTITTMVNSVIMIKSNHISWMTISN